MYDALSARFARYAEALRIGADVVRRELAPRPEASPQQIPSAESPSHETEPARGHVPLRRSVGGIHLDAMKLTTHGIVIVEGWTNEPFDESTLAIAIGGARLPVSEFFRHFRPDVVALGLSADAFSGFSLELTWAPQKNGIHACSLSMGEDVIWSSNVELRYSRPDYVELLHETAVMPRNRIYGVGEPLERIPDEIMAFLVPHIAGKTTLDFGCGRGNLVASLAERSFDVHGIEIDRDAIRATVLPEVRDRITLYDGRFPLPYADESFDTVTAVEVIEHVPDYEQALAEIHRVCRTCFVMTVPDASAIPRCYPGHVVPWHMLESTHLNFFTIRSATRLLSRHWEHIRAFKIARTDVADTHFHHSIALVCTGRVSATVGAAP